MLLMTEYRLRSHMPKADVKRLMDEFGARGAAEGEIAHYVRADASGGYTIGQGETIEAAYDDVMALLGAARPRLDALADALLEHETLDQIDVYRIAGLAEPEALPAG